MSDYEVGVIKCNECQLMELRGGLGTAYKGNPHCILLSKRVFRLDRCRVPDNMLKEIVISLTQEQENREELKK